VLGRVLTQIFQYVCNITPLTQKQQICFISSEWKSTVNARWYPNLGGRVFWTFSWHHVGKFLRDCTSMTGPHVSRVQTRPRAMYLSAVEIHSTTSFAEGLKPLAPCLKILRNIKYPCGVWQRYSVSKINGHIPSMKVSVFWDAAPCSHVEVDRRFRGAYCLHRPDYGGITHLWNVRLTSTWLHSATSQKTLPREPEISHFSPSFSMFR
jgi:hypothetical protein